MFWGNSYGFCCFYLIFSALEEACEYVFFHSTIISPLVCPLKYYGLASINDLSNLLVHSSQPFHASAKSQYEAHGAFSGQEVQIAEKSAECLKNIQWLEVSSTSFSHLK